MEQRETAYIDGTWVTPHGEERMVLVDPRNGQQHAQVRLTDVVDVERAVAAARRVFDYGPAWPLAERLATLRRLHELLTEHSTEVAETISREMGAPPELSRKVQLGMALATLDTTIRVAKDYAFDTASGNSVVSREPVGVVAAITPWNFPLHQALAKIGSALAAGCPVVLKPAETTPLTAYLLTELADEAGVPAGWLQMLPGRGAEVGAALAEHPDIDLISFTGSTATGSKIAAKAAETIKRVALELGGKSPGIVLNDLDVTDFAAAVTTITGFCMMNTGQTCAAWTRLIVPEERYEEAIRTAVATARSFVPGQNLGPLASLAQWEKVAGYVRTAVAEGAEILLGDPEPQRTDPGFHLDPVVLGRVTPQMTVGQEEIFGPVLVVQTHAGDDDAVQISNSTPYGLSAGVFSADNDRAMSVARRVRAGTVHINGINNDRLAPFGGMKQSGIGREYGQFGIEEFLEIKSIQPPAPTGTGR